MSGIYDEEILGARQQQETARRLREGVKTPEGQMVSGWYVRPSVTQYMAEALKSYYAGKSGKEAQTKYDTLTKQKKDETARYAEMLNPTPKVEKPAFQAPSQFEERDLLPGDTMTSPLQPDTQPNEQNMMAGLLGLSRVNPEAAASAMAINQWQQGRQDKQRAINQPKWEISERYNQQTGKPEKVMVDMNNPATIMPFGGQEASPIDYNKPFLPDGTPNSQYQQYAIENARAGASQQINMGAPQAVINPKTGQPELVQFGNKPGAVPQFSGLTPAPEIGKPPTEQEAKAAFYAQNMKAASATLDKLEADGLDLTKLATQANTALAGGATNIFANPQAQQAKQAQNQWAEQMLRMQTGAAATQPEIDRTVKTYFPAIGDKKETVDLKRAMRQQAEGGVFEASGRAKGRIQEIQGKPASGAKFLGFE